MNSDRNLFLISWRTFYLIMDVRRIDWCLQEGFWLRGKVCSQNSEKKKFKQHFIRAIIFIYTTVISVLVQQQKSYENPWNTYTLQVGRKTYLTVIVFFSKSHFFIFKLWWISAHFWARNLNLGQLNLFLLFYQDFQKDQFWSLSPCIVQK